MITFNELPQAVSQLNTKLDNIERLLTSNNQVKQPHSDRWFNENRIIYHKRGEKITFIKSQIDQNIKDYKAKEKSQTTTDNSIDKRQNKDYNFTSKLKYIKLFCLIIQLIATWLQLIQKFQFNAYLEILIFYINQIQLN